MKQTYQKPEAIIKIMGGAMMAAVSSGTMGDGTTMDFGDPTISPEYGNAKDFGGSIWDE